MNALIPLAGRIAGLLIARKETLGVAESSTGGLISAALLAVPGASAWYRGGTVIYTPRARAAIAMITRDDMEGLRSASEPYALLLATRVRGQLASSWGLSETGATGPDGNRYGDPAGHSCMAIAGPSLSRAVTLETGSADRVANMNAFAERALLLLAEALSERTVPH